MGKIKKIEFYLDFPEINGANGLPAFTAETIKDTIVLYDGIEYMHQICR